MRYTSMAAVFGSVIVGFCPWAEAAGPAKIASLEHSLLPLKTHFNLHDDQPRVMAILSPS